MKTTSTKRRGTMALLNCHAVFDVSQNRLYAEHPNDRPIFEAHILYAAKHLAWRRSSNPLLVISGAPTKVERALSESRSYLDWAEAEGLAIPSEVALEEYALTTIDNLLLALYVYHKTRGAYPQEIDVISWEFKRERMIATLDAINDWAPFGESWDSLNFFPVGDLPGTMRNKALEVEQEYISSLKGGLEEYYTNPITRDRIRTRDVHQSRLRAREFYAAYPLPFGA